MKLTEVIEKKFMTGYKVMNTDGKDIWSMANKRLKFPLEKGTIITMPGHGVFLSPNKEYVKDYYAGHNESEAFLTLQFDPSTIISGNLTDREPEITVKSAMIIDFKIIVEH